MSTITLPRGVPRSVQTRSRRRTGDVVPFAIATLLAATVFSRFGINLGFYSIDFSFIAIYALVTVLLLTGRARLDRSMAVWYLAGVVIAIASLAVNLNEGANSYPPSVPSLLLLIALYLPLTVTADRESGNRALQMRVLTAFQNIALFVAVVGIAQFAVQQVIAPPWLFDFTPMLPEVLRGSAGFNTVIAVDEATKSNGFFLREPSSFSFLCAIGLVAEMATARRLGRYVVLGLGLLTSYSGTGILALLVGLLLPPSFRSIVRLAMAALIGLLVFVLLGDALNLGFTINRIFEFENPLSSAYIRYIAPLQVVQDGLGQSVASFFLGQGPGTMTQISERTGAYDPTWAKVLVEYGVLGTIVFVGIAAKVLLRPGLPSSVRAVLFVCWLVAGGHLLSSEFISFLFALCGVWDERSRNTSPTPEGHG